MAQYGGRQGVASQAVEREKSAGRTAARNLRLSVLAVRLPDSEISGERKREPRPRESDASQ